MSVDAGAVVGSDNRVDAMRIEEAGLNALQTQRQLFFDGWLLRMSPGKAKRGRSVNPHFGSSLPLAHKIGYCEERYAACRLPTIFRITPFCKPADLDAALDQRGYVPSDNTPVQVVVPARPRPPLRKDVDVEPVPVAAFVAAVAALRGSPPEQQAAHLERLAQSPLALHAVVSRVDKEVVACGQVACDRDIAAIYDMATATDWRGRGLASAIVDALLLHAGNWGARVVFLQVDDDNAPAIAVYRKFGFATLYTYHYRARDGACR